MVLPSQKASWVPHLLLAGLVAGLVLGACASVRFTRPDLRPAPIAIRYTIKRKGLLLFFFPAYDTVAIRLAYQRRPVPAPGTCPQAGKHPTLTSLRRLPGAEPRWLATVRCGYQAGAYLLRVPPSGPEYHFISPVSDENWRHQLRPIQPATYLYLATTDSMGTLFDLRTYQRHVVQLPALAETDRRNSLSRSWYTVSPDGQWVGRAFSRDTATYFRPANQSRRKRLPLLLLDQRNLTTGEQQRLRLPGVWLAPTQLPQSVRWEQEAGQWKLRPVP
ncbi:hypothetical protein [Hymenobacter metallilatus]|uniref:Uncharacterized protein n=1 Tax=Hymenobacter metallilatus TaxID=2493666 RepID=A0A428JR42_9BACT|nr:hypothetical protein [Hymenobacter metallilatus]RSK35955.1 hypothetical protein EI290_03415 [Hymenobacter metallilatus]